MGVFRIGRRRFGAVQKNKYGGKQRKVVDGEINLHQHKFRDAHQ